MILDLKQLVKEYVKETNPITGIVHIGAHYGEEYNHYRDLQVPVIFFEPLLENFSILHAKLSNEPNISLFKYALGNYIGKVKMNLSSNSKASSSVLNPKHHLDLYKHIKFTGVEEVDMIRLDDLALSYHPNHPKMEVFNFITIDVQGYELEVFKGAEHFLTHVNYIIAEVNKEELYEGGVKIDQLDEFLTQHQFRRVETNWAGDVWGDAFYIKD
jgi:FkbM family methyltransferase